MGKRLRLVLDTNVFIAAYFNRRSASARIFDLCSNNEYELAISIRLWREVESILENVRTEEEFRGRVHGLFARATRVRPTKRVFLIKEDPADNKFLECALEGKADYLITSDRHLLKLGSFAQTRICKPTHFLKIQGIR